MLAQVHLLERRVEELSSLLTERSEAETAAAAAGNRAGAGSAE